MPSRVEDDRFRLLVESATAYAIITLRLDTTVETWSPGAEALFGWTAAEAIGRRGDLIFTPEDRAAGAPERERQAALATGLASDDRWHIRKDGSRFRANGMMIRLDGPGGTPLGLGKILRDTTAQARAESALQESEARFRSLADSIPQLAWVGGADGGGVWFNRRWLDYTGTTETDARGWGWIAAVHPEHADRVRERFRHHLERGETWEDTFPIRGANGQYRWFLSRARPILDESGRVAQWFGTHTDITDQRAREAALRHTQKLESLGVLAGGVAHDFNNLLTGIIGNASLAVAGLSSESRPRLRPLLDEVIRAGQRAAELTQQLLAYAGKGRVAARPLDLCALVLESEALFRVSIPSDRQLVLSLPDECPAISGDVSQLQQVVLGLVMNAAEAMEGRTGSIELLVDAVDLPAGASAAFGPDQVTPGRYVRLQVRDEGAGMTPDVQARMFDPFFTTKFLGRGLGLAAAQGILQAHGGGIAVESEPDRGTRVTILLPVAAPPGDATPEPAVASRPLRVLVVDDEELVRAVACQALADAGHAAVGAADGPTAVALVEEGEQFDVVLLDVSMPMMAGPEVARRIRAAAPALPIVAMSGYAADTAVEQFGALRIDTALQKPFTVDLLVDTVARAAAAPR